MADNTIKFLYFGDPHIRGTNPRNRTDNYSEAWKAKLREIWGIGLRHNVTAFLQPGDTFHTPDVANSVLNEAADIFSEAPAPIYTTVGNHDIPGYNVSAFGNTSLKLLERIVPNFHVVNDPSKPIYFDGEGFHVQLTFTPYSGEMDRDGYGYSPGIEYENPQLFKIHVSHGMLLDHTPPFDKFTLVQDVQTTANLVLTGHDHTGYGIYMRGDGVDFCNPGSLTRMSASQAEIDRPIQVALITVERDYSYTGTGPFPIKSTIELIHLECAKPGEEVLDRSRIEHNNEREYAMENFAALIQTSTGERVRLDINQIIETVAKQEGVDAEVVAIALQKIEASRAANKGGF